MVDSIEDSDVRRTDQNVDPTALNPDDIEGELPDDFSRKAKGEFADRVAGRRQAVRDSVSLDDRIGRNPANNQPQLKGPNGRFGPMADSVTGTHVDDSGNYVADLDPGSNYAERHGTTEFVVDSLDLQAGGEDLDEPRKGRW